MNTSFRILAVAMFVVAAVSPAQAEYASPTGLEVIGQELLPPAPPAEIVAAYPAVTCCPKLDIDYRFHRGGSRCKFDRCDLKEVVVLVNDPCAPGCCLEVPVCIPACCTVACEIDCHRGLFGRSITEFCWDCGYRLEVVVHRDRDVVVHAYGVR
jgi:hypothetical protein